MTDTTKFANDYVRALELGDKHAANAQAAIVSCVTANDRDTIVAIAKRIEDKYHGKENQQERNAKLSKLRTNLKRSFDKETDPVFWTVKKVKSEEGKVWQIVEADWPEPNKEDKLEKALELVAENADKKDVRDRLLALLEAQRDKAA